MIKITLTNSDEIKWTKEEYTDYKYDGKCFIIIKDNQWVGIYNINSIVSITIK